MREPLPAGESSRATGTTATPRHGLPDYRRIGRRKIAPPVRHADKLSLRTARPTADPAAPRARDRQAAVRHPGIFRAPRRDPNCVVSFAFKITGAKTSVTGRPPPPDFS